MIAMGDWLVRAHFYDSSGQLLTVVNAARGSGSVNRWTRLGGRIQAPADAATVRLQLRFYMASGWLAFDDVELRAVGDTNNLAPDPSFEDGDGWSKAVSGHYPGTAVWRGQGGTAAPRSGEYAYAISNHAHGHVNSTPMTIVGGQEYELATYLRGKIDAESSYNGWLLRARFYNTAGSYLGYRDADRGYNGQNIATTWQRVAGTVTAPAEAATMRVALILFQASGWVTFDDVSVTSSAEISKYYYFNGQRVAMNKNGTLTYLHSDHLGSTVVESDTAGNAIEWQEYCGYGQQRTWTYNGTICDSDNLLNTDHTYTGQKQDSTGLMYYQARYYDPTIGAFIRVPLGRDTIVPDATAVFGYNRYMYVAGNPLRLTDSSGHVWETALDAVAVGYDVYDIYQNGWSWERAGALAVDVGGMAVPFVPAAGACVRWCDDVVQYGDEALTYGDDAWQWTKGKAGDAWNWMRGKGDEVADAGRSGDCRINSFSGDTLVMTPTGAKPIAELLDSGEVIAYNEATGEIGVYRITDTISHIVHEVGAKRHPEIILLTIDGETLETTAEHPFYELEAVPGQILLQWPADRHHVATGRGYGL